MHSDYTSIRRENKKRYGTDIARIGRLLMADRYADRTQFIFELLQNAEDALTRRDGWSGPCEVVFELFDTALRVSHFGIPFTEDDVRGICGIGVSEHTLTSIGRFGIGFKSVYAYTDSPEVHSGDEHFAIDDYVWPRAVPARDIEPGQTVFILPLRPNDGSAKKEITEGLQRIGPRVLLFLREIEEISWVVEGKPSGTYLRDKPERIAGNARKVVIVGEGRGDVEVTEETWLIFSRAVYEDDRKAGRVEVAFALEDNDGNSLSVRPLNDSPLVVFFPTIVSTNLGFLVQGPYRTTPSRDNVPRNDPWNEHLAQETSVLLVEALHGLRELGLLDESALSSLPLDSANFEEESMFAPLFDQVREALRSQPLLPRFGGGYVAGAAAKMARTQELRELFSPPQLAALFQTDQELSWLSQEITLDRTPKLWNYLRYDLDMDVVTPRTILRELTKPFLEDQSDEWIVRLYEFLRGRYLLRDSRHHVPLVRLEDGSHVIPWKNDRPQAFLPGPTPTDFPTVSPAVCTTEAARAALTDLGLAKADLVDDIARNVLPKYEATSLKISPKDYEADIQRILQAFATDSKTEREKLIRELRDASFVISVDAGDGSRWHARPDRVYLASQPLKALFEGVPDVLFVDDSYSCLCGEDITELLEACGAARHLQPMRKQIRPPSRFTSDELKEIRRKAGCEDRTAHRKHEIDDFTLRGLEDLLDTLSNLDPASAKEKANLLWKALCDLEAHRRDTNIRFFATYYWYYYSEHSYKLPAMFIDRLNETAWVPDRTGTLHPPRSIIFEDTDWKPNQFLLSKIDFKPPEMEALAQKVGIEPDVFNLLKQLGLTSVADLRERLDIPHDASQTKLQPDDPDLTPAEAPRKPHTPPPSPPVETGKPKSRSEDPKVESPGPGAQEDAASHDTGTGRASTGGNAPRFISYLGVHTEEDEPDPDDLGQQERMVLEEQAINLIVKYEPQLSRMSVNNPGFDLVEEDEDDQPIRWVEVKAMTRNLKSHPVGLSRTQFETAQERGERYWLYVVEHARSSPEEVRIVKIQDPAGKARTFTFDYGWLSVAEVSDAVEIGQDGRSS